MVAFVKICRLIALSLLFGGSSAIVFAAITLVRAAGEHGMTVAQAASYNAPIFVHFSTVALVAAAVLMATELIDYQFDRKFNRHKLVRYGASFLCFACTVVFSLWLTPMMEQVRPNIEHDPAAHELFDKLHHTSKIIFLGTIIFALVSLTAPALETKVKS